MPYNARCRKWELNVLPLVRVTSWLIQDPSTRLIAQIVAIVGLARVLGRGARWVGQPAVVAEIIAGIVLGPSVLGWVAPVASATLFPPESLDVLRSASELGLVLFVFLVGLELDLGMLRGRLHASFAIGLASLAVPFALGAALAFHPGVIGARGGRTLDMALFLGATMGITAFPVLARMLADHHLLRTRLGALAIACAAIDDLLAWCLLAFLVALVRAGSLAGALATSGLAMAFVATMWLVVRPVLGRLANRARTPLTASPDAVALAVIGALGSAWITQRIGIHLVFGAFAFGAILPKRDGFARAIAEKLEDVVTVVLLPLFFATSGLRTHVDLLASASHLTTCAVIVAVACAGKLGGTALTARATGLPWREAGALAVLMNTRGLMELVVLNVGFELGVFPPMMFSMLVVMVLVTTLAATPLLARIYPPQDVIRDLLAAEPRGTARRANMDRVLACIQRPETGPHLIELAGALAHAGSEIVALHLAPEEDPAIPARDATDGDEALGPALARAHELGLSVRPLAFASHDPAEDIVRVADVRGAELVLVGHAGRAGDLRFEGVVRDVLRQADTEVLVFVDRGFAAPPSRLLVATAGEVPDQAALAIAERLRRATGAPIVALDAGRADDAVADADLVVIGLGQDRGSHRSRVEQLLRDCSASVLVVRGPRGDLARAVVER